MVTVRVPATTANLGPGFDTLGLALALYNTLTFEELAEGLYFEGVDPEYATAENLAVVAYKAVLSKLGLPRLTLIRTPGAVVLGMVYNYLPYMILPLYGVIVKIDPRLIEAAEDLGCNSTQVFSRVVLPLSVPGILSGMTMAFVPAVSTFYISQKLGGTDTVLIGDVIERQFKQGNNPNLGAALSLVLIILVFICTGIMNRFGGGNEEGGVIV